MPATHDVLNQPPRLQDRNLFADDLALQQAARREGAAAFEDALGILGRKAGSAEVIQWGFDANENLPVLQTHDRTGHRVDRVHYHPSWHDLLRLSTEAGLHGAVWADPRPGAHVARAAGFILVAQAEAGHGCPISMTYSVVPPLRSAPELAARWEPKVTTRAYDERFLPIEQKTGALMGMAMTEKQGGSDVRANTTRATPAEPDGIGFPYRLTGHKWFCSAPMCDGFLVLAQAPKGLTCFLLPRVLPDATANGFFIQRLKNKLGNKSNASSEIELENALAWRVGEEGRGVPTIIEMTNHTRLDCTLGAAGIMRGGLVQAIHHARHRSTFGQRLVDHALMKNVLADLAIESEATTLVALRLARAFENRDPSSSDAAFRRIATPIAKYWTTKRSMAHVAEAMECLGGNGYTEDFPLARMYRESPVNSIWEGSGNVICLDVLRALRRTPEVFGVLRDEILLSGGQNPAFDEHWSEVETLVQTGADSQARRLVEGLALALEASLVVRFSPEAVANAFCASRLDGGEYAFGTLPEGTDFNAVLDRALP